LKEKPMDSAQSLVAAQDKRNHPRTNCHIPVKLRNMDPDDLPQEAKTLRPQTLQTFISDLSLGGAFLEFPGALKAGKLYHLQVEMPKPYSALVAFIEVRWANDKGGGIQFLAIQEERLKDLKNYLQTQSA
jgi:hypothetical protein